MLLLFAAPMPGGDALTEPVVIPELPDLVKPDAKGQAEARQAYARSVELYQAGDVKGALAAAERVYEIMPNASTALFRSRLLEGNERPCAAVATLAAALDMDPTEKERNDIRAALKRAGRACKPGAAWARVRAVPGDAQVRIDGRDIPSGRTVVLKAGVHAVEVEAPGYARLRASLTADPGEEVPAEFETERLMPETPVVEGSEPVEGAAEDPAAVETGPMVMSGAAERAVEESPSRLAPWLLAGGGVALVAAGIGMNVWALDAASEARGYLGPQPDMSDDDRKGAYDAAGESATSRAVTAYVLYGAGAVALGTGVVWLLTSPDGEESSGWRAAPWVVPGGAGLSLSGGL